MGYSTDQWNRLWTRASGETLSVQPGKNDAGYYLTGKNDNDTFIYPNRIVRSTGGKDDPLLSETRLKRGYIRNIPFGDTTLENIKCHFQFNPTTLNQSITQSQGVLNFLLQDTAQFAQPMIGNTSFSFSLMFDRSAEMNNAPLVNKYLDVNESNVWEQLGPSEVGVFHDLSRLYSIIGVGVSERIKDYALATYAQQSKVEYSDLSAEEQAEQLSEAEAEAELANRISMNVGNSAFLMALPVRVVFSSLYIVEGLVDGIAVEFSKFNHAMVPMQCGVTVTMKAMYVGFAKKNTFFTESLSELAIAEREDQPVDELATSTDTTTVNKDLLDRAREELGSVTLRVMTSNGASSESLTTGGTSDDITNFISYSAVSGTGATLRTRWDREATLKVYFPNVEGNTDNPSNLIGVIGTSSSTVTLESAKVDVYAFQKNEFSSGGAPIGGSIASTVPTINIDGIKDSVGELGGENGDTPYVISCVSSSDREAAQANAPKSKLLRSFTLTEGTKGADGKPSGPYLSVTASRDDAHTMLVKDQCYSARQKVNSSAEATDIFNLTTEPASTSSSYGLLSSASFLGPNAINILVSYRVVMSLSDSDGNSTRVESKKDVVLSSYSSFTYYSLLQDMPLGWPQSEDAQTQDARDASVYDSPNGPTTADAVDRATEIIVERRGEYTFN